MSYLVFASEQDANDAIAVINENMGFPHPGGTTTTWSDIYFSVEDTWFFEKPEVQYMANVPATFIEVENPPQRYFPPSDDE